jgi:hypothetical protein
MPSQKGRMELEQALREVMEGAAVEARPPASTYRLQLSSTFGFDEARAIIPYLHSLGVSALYLSPILKARAGSTHGYDVIDFGRINPELGGEPRPSARPEQAAGHRKRWSRGRVADASGSVSDIGRVEEPLAPCDRRGAFRPRRAPAPAGSRWSAGTRA